MIVHHVATTVRRPVDEVARYLFDPRTMPQWSAVLFSVQDPDDVPLLRRGRRLRANLQLLGVSVSVEGEVSELDVKARRASVRIVPIDGDGEIRHELETTELEDEATVVHFRNWVEPPTWLRQNVEMALIRTFVEASAAFALRNISAILESRQEDAIARALEHAGDLLLPPEAIVGHHPRNRD